MKRLLAIFILMAAFFVPPQSALAGISVIRDEEIEQTLKTFARPIFQEAGLSPQTVRFILVDDSNLNAFVAGGQNIFINTGLILETKNPAELIGVIAHESGHISGGHLFRTAEAIEDMTFQTMLANIIGIAAGAGAQSGDVGMAVGSAGSEMAMRMLLRHSRVQEASADQAGVRFLKGAGLPLDGFLSFMEKLSSQELLPESQQSEYVRTHPLSRDRVDFLENTVAQEKDRQGAAPPEWDGLHTRMKAKLLGYLYPDRALMSDKGNSIEAQYARTIATYRKGKNPEALAMIDGLLKSEPRNPYFHELKGQILFESGKAADALTPYKTAVGLVPSSGLIRSAYGRALAESGQYDAAITELQKSLDTEPRAPETHRMLAIVYGKQGKEGLSRLHMAEEALLRDKTDFAKKEADLAKKALPKASPGWLRADDILDAIKRKKKKKSG
jgi:predicted Zn-dependent protease